MRIFSAGWQKIINANMPRQMKQHMILAQSEGPQICIAMTKGFNVNCKRPVGGGQYGSVLGSLRPEPTTMTFALSLGQSCMLEGKAISSLSS